MADEAVDYYTDLPCYQETLRDHILVKYRDPNTGNGMDTELTYLTEDELKSLLLERCPVLVLDGVGIDDLVGLAWAAECLRALHV